VFVIPCSWVTSYDCHFEVNHFEVFKVIIGCALLLALNLCLNAVIYAWFFNLKYALRAGSLISNRLFSDILMVGCSRGVASIMIVSSVSKGEHPLGTCRLRLALQLLRRHTSCGPCLESSPNSMGCKILQCVLRG
jgi:hypothetical protein